MVRSAVPHDLLELYFDLRLVGVFNEPCVVRTEPYDHKVAGNLQIPEPERVAFCFRLLPHFCLIVYYSWRICAPRPHSRAADTEVTYTCMYSDFLEIILK